jgi:hypothetical protein
LLLILVLAVIRVVFGLVRYAFFGGDDVNPYRNFEWFDITLVYFDIVDNYIVVLVVFCFVWLMLMPEVCMSL